MRPFLEPDNCRLRIRDFSEALVTDAHQIAVKRPRVASAKKGKSRERSFSRYNKFINS